MAGDHGEWSRRRPTRSVVVSAGRKWLPESVETGAPESVIVVVVVFVVIVIVIIVVVVATIIISVAVISPPVCFFACDSV